jgi:hypothetical protein
MKRLSLRSWNICATLPKVGSDGGDGVSACRALKSDEMGKSREDLPRVLSANAGHEVGLPLGPFSVRMRGKSAERSVAVNNFAGVR